MTYELHLSLVSEIETLLPFRQLQESWPADGRSQLEDPVL